MILLLPEGPLLIIKSADKGAPRGNKRKKEK